MVETAVQRRHLPGKEEVRPEGPQSKAQSKDEGEHGPCLEAGLLLKVPDRLPRMVGRHIDGPDRPSIAFSSGCLKSSSTTSRMRAAMYLLVCWPSMAGNCRTCAIVASSAAV